VGYESASGAEWSVPAGAPIKVYQWLLPPIILVALAVIETYVASTEEPRRVAMFHVVAAVLLFASAIALWILGYRAYRDLTQTAVNRYRAIGVISLLVAAFGLLFGFLAPVPLIVAGYLSALLPWARVTRVRALLPTRGWLRVLVGAAAVAVVCVLLVPLAVGLGSIPLIVIVTAGRILAPFVVGFAFRLWRAPRALPSGD
jgi:hypothetical protein